MEQLDIHVRKKMDIFTAYTKMDWGLNIYLTIISKAIKLLEENISGYLCDMGQTKISWVRYRKINHKLKLINLTW